MKRKEPIPIDGDEIGATPLGAPPAKKFKPKETELDPGYVPLWAPNSGLDERLCRLESNLAHLQQVCSIQARTISNLRVTNDKYASQIKTLRRLVTKQFKSGEERTIDECGSCFLMLPSELMANIVQFCEFQDQLALRASCTDLNWIVNTTVTELPFSASSNLMLKGARSFFNLQRLSVTGDVNMFGFRYVAQLPKLRSLVVHNVRHLSDDAFSVLTACTNLRTLSIRTAFLFTNHGLEYLYQLTWLKHLDLRDLLNINFPGSAALAENLRSLTVRDCVNFRANFPLLGEYTNLRSLYMDSAPCEQLYCLKFTTSLVNLESLVLTPWVSKSEQPQLRMCYLTNLTSLTRLDLQCNAVVDWESLSKMTKLQSLAVANNFTEEEIGHLYNLPRLSSLSICYNDNVDDEIMEKLAPLADRLTDLDLQGCPMITKCCLDALSTLTSLRRLNLKETAALRGDVDVVPPGVILADNDDAMQT